ncbi:hypothetical protein ISX56_27450 [Serratia ureilytica]|nr:hypothetical protein [Serratia ureilytica]
MMQEPEALRVLDATATAAGWQHELPSGVSRGMACNIWVGRNNAFTTYVGLVVEIAIQEGRLRVLRAVCAIDCGNLKDAVSRVLLTLLCFSLGIASYLYINQVGVQQFWYGDLQALVTDSLPTILNKLNLAGTPW